MNETSVCVELRHRSLSYLLQDLQLRQAPFPTPIVTDTGTEVSKDWLGDGQSGRGARCAYCCPDSPSRGLRRVRQDEA